MLLVHATKGPSPIHGQGLIARQFIPKGTRMWEFRRGYDQTFTPEQLMALPAFARQQVLYYSYYDPRSRLYVTSLDDDRHTNHAENPNCILDDDGDSTIASRDIHEGEEILWDYRPWGGVEHHFSEVALMPHERYDCVSGGKP